MTVRPRWLSSIAIALVIVVVGCGNVRSKSSPDFRLVASYLRDVDDPALRITVDTRTEGVSNGSLELDADPDKTCGVEDLTFHLPAGFERTENSISIDCPESLNGPGFYRGDFLGQNCLLTNVAVPREDGGWSMSVSAVCYDEPTPT